MLELLFQGFIEWIYGLILECWEYFASVLFDLMSLDFAYLREHMPVIDTIRQIMLGVGWALLIGNLVFQASHGMAAGLGFDAEDPKLLFTRTFAFSFLLVASPQICELGLNMTSTVIELLQMPDAVDITFADEASFAGMSGAWLLVVICGIIVMFQTFKLIMEMAERYKMAPEELPDYAGLTTCRVIDYIPEWRRKEAETAPQKRPQAPAQKEAPHSPKPPVNEKQPDRSGQPPAYDLAEDDEIGMVECTVDSILNQ